ncbi:hypothetical protein PGTUg99_003647 [Puccinia graminis f. sp. tritici]|uniref:Uncharacterized protein n=1 Tax=Puccinia graminis f. sp. tritici TaxID=56615 RepID=A0A5B0QVF7_PUCGR|nr:hypothetical protein PGTUg99_003647 [Puccinia graminis f. sp. tritici]
MIESENLSSLAAFLYSPSIPQFRKSFFLRFLRLGLHPVVCSSKNVPFSIRPGSVYTNWSPILSCTIPVTTPLSIISPAIHL